MEKQTFVKTLNTSIEKKNADSLAVAVSGSGRARPMEVVDEREIYYSAFPNVSEISMITFSGETLHEPVEKALLASSWHMHRKHQVYYLDEKQQRLGKQVWLYEGGYMLLMSGDSYSSTSEKIRQLLEMPEEPTKKKGDRVSVVDSTELFFPTSHIGTHGHKDILENLTKIFTDNFIEEDKGSSISIISQDGRDFYAKKFSLRGHIPEAVHMNEHYGDGFLDFYEKLLERIKSDSKGLVLFHGEPGTGKTQFIRMLLDELTRHKKSILYAPPSLSAQLTEPHMIEFISDWVMDEENDCILLIEDAEPLLEVRNGADGRSTGISNLLNITDGILNDMLGLMVIATFNTSISKIDSALLRPQRLIARKEFSKLSFDRGEALAEALGIGNPLDVDQYPASLADFYSAKKQTQILVHEIKEERKIGFK
jgi:hypothetical protein